MADNPAAQQYDSDSATQFAAKIRQKHPGTYDDLSDMELTQRILAKHPEYRDMVKPASQTNPMQQYGGSGGVDPQTQMGVAQLWDSAKSALIGGVEGFAKSAADTASKMPPLMQMRQFFDTTAKAFPQTPAGQVGQQIQQLTTPQGTAQNVGAGVEQTGEMMASGGPLKQGAEEIASRLPGILSRLSAPALRVAAEAANTGGNAAIHGQPITPAAATGAIGSTAGELLSPVAKALKIMAQKQYLQALNPTTGPNKFLAQKIIPELLEQNQLMTSPASLATKAFGKAQEAGKGIEAIENSINQPQMAYRARDVGEQGVPSASHSQATLDPRQAQEYLKSRAATTGKPQEIVGIDLSKLKPGDYQQLTNSPQPDWIKFSRNLSENEVSQIGGKAPANSIKPVIDRLDQLKSKYTVGGQVPETMKAQANYIDTLKSDIQNMALNGQARTADLVKMRRLLDEPIAASGGFAGAQFIGDKKIAKATSDSMRQVINSDNPDLAEINKTFNFWKNVQRVAGATAQRKVGQQGAIKALYSAAGAAGGFAHGGPMEAAIGGIAMPLIQTAVTSPAWRTTSAVFKNQVADALASGRTSDLVRLLERFGSSQGGTAVRDVINNKLTTPSTAPNQPQTQGKSAQIAAVKAAQKRPSYYLGQPTQ